MKYTSRPSTPPTPSEPAAAAARGAVAALALTGWLGLAVGCADPCANLPSPEIEIGGADVAGATYEPFEPGATRPLVVGPQGGAHVWLQMRLRGVCPDTLILDRRVFDEEGALVTAGRNTLALVEVEEHTWALEEALQVRLCPDSAGRTIDGAALRFDVRAEDAEGRVAEAELPFVASCGGDAQCLEFCVP